MPHLNWEHALIQSRFSPRGTRLEWRLVNLKVGGRSYPGLAFNAPPWVKVQLQPELERHGAEKVRVGGRFGDEWLEIVRLERAPDGSFLPLLELLQRVISIRPRNEALAACLAFDMYKIPDDETDPQQWPNTHAGELVNRSKYWGSEDHFNALVGWMVDCVRKHPSLATTDLVMSVPGKDANVVGHGQRLAASVAGELGKPFLATRPTYERRDAAKEGFVVTPDLFDISAKEVSGRRVLVVDDVCRSGHSLGSIAQKATTMGARRVFAFVCAKTLKN